MNPEARFRELLSKLLDDECSVEERDELARLCQNDGTRRETLRAELEISELIRHAISDTDETGRHFSRSVKSRLSGDLPDFAALTARLIDGDIETPELDDLVRHCWRDQEHAAQLRRELKWADLLGQATADARSEEAFVESLASRLKETGNSGESPDSASLATQLIDGELEPHEIDELVQYCSEDPKLAAQLRSDLKWADLVGQATAESRSEDAFVESLATRMWAEQEQDHFVEKTQSKIVSLFPDTAHQADKKHRASNIISIGTWATAAAAAIALGAIFLVDRPGNAVAEIVHATDDVRWRTGSDLKSHDRLEAGSYALDAGIVTLEFANGAEMTIEGPAEFDLRGENEAFVHSGIAMLNQDEKFPSDKTGTPKSKAGFNLQSNGLNLVDSRDTVGIDARSTSSTEAVVFNGGAEVCLPTVGNCRNLYEYEAVRVDLKRDKILDIPYNPRVFARSWEVLAGVERNTGSVRIELPGKKPEKSPSSENEMQIFVERNSFVADRRIEVDTLDPGKFADASNSKGRDLEEKGALRSYLLQLWPENSEKDSNLEASVTFDHEVVGVIYSSERLEQSDSIVGTEMASNSAEVTSSRGLDNSETDGDSILLSDDRRTVNLRLKSGRNSDQLDHVRILVALR